MKTYIGIDLGTSSLKMLLADAQGNILNSVSRPYPVLYPAEGWTEQDPACWIDALNGGMESLLRGFDPSLVRGIGTGGQMHGLVACDGSGKPVRPCILWNDGRTAEQTQRLNSMGRQELAALCGNVAFAGFTAPKLMWLKQNEPQNFARIRKIMLPKDYITYYLTGEHVTDYSDASGTLLLDVKNKRWSNQLCSIVGIDMGILPLLKESYAPAGKLKPDLAARWKMKDVTVCAGAGDNAAAAVGTGTVGDGGCTVSIGTSGTVFVSRKTFSADSQNALHSFCHADGGYHLMGCILSAASAGDWWQKILQGAGFNSEQRGLNKYMGKNEVFFAPYLSGERCPHNDVGVRGAFLGLSHTTTRGEMTLAVMEGVAFALNDCIQRARSAGADITSAILCGGGAKSPLWREICADVFDIPICIPAVEEGPAYGAAILAMTACGEYPDVHTACKALTRTALRIEPDPVLAASYKTKYGQFTRIYPQIKGLFN